MQSVKDILKQFDPLKDKYISREFQAFGVHLAQKLQDEKHKSLYIKLAKTIHRPVLEQALRYVIDSNARNKAALFMWKLKEIGAFKKSQIQSSKSQKNPEFK
ncbi:hypothetical protein HY612_02870 [Candidatus Roizmanbacteria bacterium]|nr:hypothetical protein [Candidatus Roizmanbacteria bacterium]